ncbi:hypothetical protein [Shewanella pneumatophori]|uniref:Uncharacterized protein n=1 Tax=Shewanella pneumatophori TaxID=314092 RepID=A0A9X2CDN3_9GAMM|nr:hypothetical protein [Shewanella pneumatophori]MCL1139383.1 hypothetical protein [Shewanella pneumatophori]
MNQLQYRLEQETLKTNQAILAAIENSHRFSWQDYITLLTSLLTIFIAIVVPLYLFFRQRKFEVEVLEKQRVEFRKAAVIRLMHQTTSMVTSVCKPLLFIANISKDLTNSEQLEILNSNNMQLVEELTQFGELGAELRVIFNDDSEMADIYLDFQQKYNSAISKSLLAFKECKTQGSEPFWQDKYDFNEQLSIVRTSGEAIVSILQKRFKEI